MVRLQISSLLIGCIVSCLLTNCGKPIVNKHSPEFREVDWQTERSESTLEISFQLTDTIVSQDDLKHYSGNPRLWNRYILEGIESDISALFRGPRLIVNIRNIGANITHLPAPQEVKPAGRLTSTVPHSPVLSISLYLNEGQPEGLGVSLSETSNPCETENFTLLPLEPQDTIVYGPYDLLLNFYEQPFRLPPGRHYAVVDFTCSCKSTIHSDSIDTWIGRVTSPKLWFRVED